MSGESATSRGGKLTMWFDHLPSRHWNTQRVLVIYSVAFGCAVGLLAGLAVGASSPWLALIAFLVLIFMPLLLPGENGQNNGEPEGRSGPAVRNGEGEDQYAAQHRGRNETFPGTTLIRP
jgi:hypothetical protein